MELAIKQSRRGFTLVELLVVIAIIALLAAILFPVFGRVREQARRSSCASNEKQLGMAFHLYETDYDEFPPNGALEPGDSGNHQGMGWAGQVYPYAKSTNVFSCPDDPIIYKVGNTKTEVSYADNIGASGIPGAVAGTRAGYTTLKKIACDGIPGPTGNCIGQMWPLSSYASPSKTVLLAEFRMPAGVVITSPESANVQASAACIPGIACNCVAGTNCQGNALGYSIYGGLATGIINGYMRDHTYYSLTASAASSALPAVHSDGANFLFHDGHVKWLRGSMVTGGDNNATGGDCGNGTSVAANTDCAKYAATYSIY